MWYCHVVEQYYWISNPSNLRWNPQVHQMTSYSVSMQGSTHLLGHCTRWSPSQLRYKTDEVHAIGTQCTLFSPESLSCPLLQLQTSVHWTPAASSRIQTTSFSIIPRQTKHLSHIPTKVYHTLTISFDSVNYLLSSFCYCTPISW